MRLRHGQAVFLMLVVTLLWSTAGVVSRHIEGARGFEVTFWRSFFTMVSLLIILPLWQGRQVFQRIAWRSRSLWVSGLCWSVMFTAFMLALTLTKVANVLVTMSVGPLLTALVAWVFIGHRIAARTWAAIVLAGIGIGWMYGSQLGSAEANMRTWLGSLVALCVPIAGAINWTVVQRSHAHGEDIDLVPAVLVGAILSSALTLPLSLPWAATPGDIGWLATLGLWQLAIPCALSVMCARVLKAPEVSLLALLEVIFGILWAWWGAGEVPGKEVFWGGGLVIAALLANEGLGWRESRNTA